MTIVVPLLSFPSGNMTATTVDRLEKKTARETVERAHETLGLPYTELAEALGVDRRTLLRYRKESHAPSPRVRAQLEKLREMRYLLLEIFEDEDAATEWLYSPVPALRGRRSIDLVRRGELDEVIHILAGLYSGSQA